MKEGTREVFKSVLLGLSALIALICWLKFQPRLPDVKPKEKIGRRLLETFDNVAQMERVIFSRINPDTGEYEEFVLAHDKENDQWLLPGMSNFPAENAEQVAKVVAPLIQLTVLDVVDETIDPSNLTKITHFHKECGLLNPINFVAVDSSDSEEGKNLSNGAALSVKIEGSNGETLVDLLVGARAPESSATRDNRYVRFPSEDVVYTVDFSGDSTSEVGTTEFAEYPERVSFDPLSWVDRDLLRISRWDVRYLTIRDYSFSLYRNGDKFEQSQIDQKGIAVFKQDPEQSLSRVWSLYQLFKNDGQWKKLENVDLENVQNDTLNTTVDVLGSLKITDVRKKPDSLRSCFENDRLESDLITQADSLGEFGFSFFDSDPLNVQKITPSLVGEGGTIEFSTKTGVKITLIFGKKFDKQRACLAYASFDKKALEEASEDESEVAFIAPEAEKKAQLKNRRLAGWFYLVSEEDYQNVRFRLADTLKQN